MGCALRHAGVAITVTSLTDFAAFTVGATTVSVFLCTTPVSGLELNTLTNLAKTLTSLFDSTVLQLLCSVVVIWIQLLVIIEFF